MCATAAGLRSGPRREYVAAWSMIGVAAMVFVAGVRRLATSPYGPEEVTFFISGGLGPMLGLVAGLGVLLAVDVRDCRRKVERLEALLGFVPTTVPTGAHRWRSTFLLTGFPIGAGLVAAGWVRASRSADLHRALEGFGAGWLGLCLAIAAVGAYTAQERRTYKLRLRNATAIAGPGSAIEGVKRAAGAMLSMPNANDTAAWTAPGLRRYHRRSCAALASARGEPFLIQDNVALEPCLLCQPED